MSKRSYDWNKLYEEYLESGLSKNAFAKEKHLGMGAVYGHFKEIEEGYSAKATFSEVAIVEEIPQTITVIIDGITIEFPTSINEKYLRQIIKAVRSC